MKDVVVSGYFNSTLTGTRKPEIPKDEFQRPPGSQPEKKVEV
jgi:hypothetical protein